MEFLFLEKYYSPPAIVEFGLSFYHNDYMLEVRGLSLKYYETQGPTGMVQGFYNWYMYIMDQFNNEANDQTPPIVGQV